MKKKTIIASVFSALLFIWLNFVLFAQSSQQERILKVGIESEIDAPDPWGVYTTLTHKILWNIYEPLVALEEKSTKIKPYLATSWYTTDNDRIWLVKLREGVKFHDGSTLSADDVVASVSLFQDFKGKVEKVDNLIVRFTLPEPNGGFLNGLSPVKFAISPAKAVEQYKTLKRAGRSVDFVPVGSGPFKLSRWEKGKQIVLESFADYWQDSPWLNRLIYQIIPDNKARISALEKGEIGLIDVLFPADLPRIKNNPQFRMISIYGMNVCFIVMNTTHKPLDNLKVRRALSLAVDKLRLARVFYYGGYGVPTNRILSPVFWGFGTMPRPGKYQPAKAKQMLAEAGYKTGLSLNLACIPMVRPYLPDPKGIVEEIKKEFAAIGVKLNIIMPSDWPELNAILVRGDFDMALFGWIPQCGDPDKILSELLSSESINTPLMKNYTRWQNKQFDEKLRSARQLPFDDIQGRIKLYNEAQKIFQNEVPLLPLFHTKIFLVHNRRIQEVILYPSSMISYHKVRIKD